MQHISQGKKNLLKKLVNLQYHDIILHLFLVHWTEWSIWGSYKQIDDANTNTKCFKGVRYRERQCSWSPTTLPTAFNYFGESCSHADVKGYIDFEDTAGDGKETEFEEANEYDSVSLIPSCSEYY